MKQNKQMLVWVVEQDQKVQPSQPQPLPNWMLFLLYLAWLRATRPQPHPSVTVLHTLIIAVALVLTVVALVAAGAPEAVVEMMKHWPIAP